MREANNEAHVIQKVDATLSKPPKREYIEVTNIPDIKEE
jgi:hypothetical protein